MSDDENPKKDGTKPAPKKPLTKLEVKLNAIKIIPEVEVELKSEQQLQYIQDRQSKSSSEII